MLFYTLRSSYPEENSWKHVRDASGGKENLTPIYGREPIVTILRYGYVAPGEIDWLHRPQNRTVPSDARNTTAARIRGAVAKSK